MGFGDSRISQPGDAGSTPGARPSGDSGVPPGSPPRRAIGTKPNEHAKREMTFTGDQPPKPPTLSERLGGSPAARVDEALPPTPPPLKDPVPIGEPRRELAELSDSELISAFRWAQIALTKLSAEFTRRGLTQDDTDLVIGEIDSTTPTLD